MHGFQCSEVCGGGIKERKVVCQPFDGTRELSDEEMCVEPKPLSSIPCNEHPCKSQPSYVTIAWNFGEWSKVKNHLNYLRLINHNIRL